MTSEERDEQIKTLLNHVCDEAERLGIAVVFGLADPADRSCSTAVHGMGDHVKIAMLALVQSLGKASADSVADESRVLQ